MDAPKETAREQSWFLMIMLFVTAIAVMLSGLPGHISDTFDGVVASL